MAFANVIPEIWSTRFQMRLDKELIWGGLVNRNYEGDIAAAGDTVKIPKLTKKVTVKDYSVNTDIDAAEVATFTTVDFPIAQQKYFNIYVDDIDAVQAAPNGLDQFLNEAVKTMGETVDTYIAGKATIDTAIRDPNTVAVGSTSSKFTASSGTNRSNAGDALMAGLADLRTKMFTDKTLRLGLTTPNLVISQEVYGLLRLSLIHI